MRRNWFILLLLVLIVVGVVFFVLNRSRLPIAAQTPAGGEPIGAAAKPKPVAQTFHGCPATGDGGDPALNTLKNRIDEAQWQPASLASILALTWPPDIERQPRARWSEADRADIARNEGAPVQVEGYLVDVRRMGPESCNCHSVDDVDFHIWLVDDPNKGREQSVVIETSPRVRSVHPAWTLAKLRDIVSGKRRVRISGWVMMDPEHPDQVGKTRGTIWEIHPVMQIETQSGGTWRPLDNGTTGVSSAQAGGQAAGQATPEASQNTPAAAPGSNPNAQTNNAVQIVTVRFDGTKGNKEPDEYVELANTGKEPVDISGWSVLSLSHDDQFTWDKYVLQPQAHIRVYTNEVHSDTGGFSFGSPNPVWTNTGDVAELLDQNGAVVSRYAYGNKK